MKTRATLIGIGLLVVALLLAACAPAAAPTAAPSGAKPITLRLWIVSQWSGLTGLEPEGQPLDWTNAMIEKFRETHPNVTVEVEDLSEADIDINTKYDTSLAAKTIAEIIWLDESFFIKYVNLGVLEPIDDFLTAEDKDDFFTANLSLSNYQGKQWFWPFLTAANHMAINADIFRERGVEDLLPKAPDYTWTWEDFVQAAKATTFDRNGDGEIDVYGVAFSTDGGYTMVENWGVHLYERGKEDRTTINTPDAVEGYQALVDLIWEDKVAMPGSGTGAIDTDTAFLQGQVAMIVTWGIATEVEQLDEKFDLVLANFPTAKGAPPIVWGGTHGLGITQQTDPDKLEAAMELARFLTNAEAQKVTRTFHGPARNSVLATLQEAEDFRYSKYLPMFAAYTSNLIPLMGQGPHSVEVIVTYEPLVEAIFTRDLTPQDALAEFEEKANAILQE